MRSLTTIFSALNLISKKLPENTPEKVLDYLAIINQNCYKLLKERTVWRISRAVSKTVPRISETAISRLFCAILSKAENQTGESRNRACI